MKKQKFKNTITLTNRKLIQTWDLSQELLDQILNDYSDDLIFGRLFGQEKTYRCKLCSSECGIIYNYQISKNLYHLLRNHLKLNNLICVERREE